MKTVRVIWGGGNYAADVPVGEADAYAASVGGTVEKTAKAASAGGSAKKKTPTVGNTPFKGQVLQ
jgi:hypothetical protein